MSDLEKGEMTEEEVTEAVARVLSDSGVQAFSQDTGGGISCVVVPRDNGGEIIWGTADFIWGASVTDADGQVISSIETNCPSRCQDPAEIAKSLRQSSIDAGAANPNP